jgi:hypothetical protein
MSEWHVQFRAGRTSTDQHTNRLLSYTAPNTVAKLGQLVREDRRRAIQDPADVIRTGYGTLLTDSDC